MADISYRNLLCDPGLFDFYSSGDWFFDGAAEKLFDALFTIGRGENRHQPDYIHMQRQNMAFPNLLREERFRLGPLLFKALRTLAGNYLEVKRGKIYIKNERLPQWQDLLTRVNPVPFLAMCAHEACPTREEATMLLYDMLNYSSLPSCHDPYLQDLCTRRTETGTMSVQLLQDHRSEGSSVFPGGIFSSNKSGPNMLSPLQGCLYDLHFHWNGTTEADFVWMNCLGHPEQMHRELCEKWTTKSHVRRFYKQHGLSGPGHLYRRVKLAQWLHRWLAFFVLRKLGYRGRNLFDVNISANDFSAETLWRALRSYGEDLQDSYPPLTSFMRGPMHSLRPFLFLFNLNHATSLQLEGIMWLHLIELLHSGSPLIAYLLHPYLLIQSSFTQLLVQQYTQVGFDQFQAITDIGLREHAESHSYYQRFMQLEGTDGPYLAYTEGRFSPKLTTEGNIKLIHKIISGYMRAHGIRHKKNANGDGVVRTGGKARISDQDIGIIAHFIKSPDTTHSKVCRYNKLRAENMKRALALVGARKRSPLVKKILVGKDAAANEMHTPPEIYAPVFRYLAAQGIHHSTYHAGEDYLHLASGIRAVEESILFLNLGSGDRIGHCTALGICPDLWRSSLPPKIFLPQGEWLDNLVWIAMKIRKNTHMSGTYTYFSNKIDRLFLDIYNMPTPPLYTLNKAWKIRSLDPMLFHNRHVEECYQYVYSCYKKGNILPHEPQKYWMPVIYASAFIRSEIKDMIRSICKDVLAFTLFKKYHSLEIRERYDKEIEIDRDDIPVEVFRLLQDRVVERMCERNILAEVMPTSNLRISFYKQYADHHMALWVDPNNTRPKPSITLATDDAGIFATNLRNEYSHFIQVLTRELKMPLQEAYAIARSLIANGKVFRFTAD